MLKVKMQNIRISEWIGFMKSMAMYHWKPFTHRKLRRFYQEFIHDGDLCFDIGAHVGNRTKAWAALGARVIAVEPQPSCVRYLRRKYRHRPDIAIVDAAIGAAEGSATLHLNSANPTISTLANADWRDQLARDAHYPVRWDRQREVEVTTLDALIEEYGMPAFCKLDVENYEYEALCGLSRPLPQLSFEYYPPKMDKAFLCLERLEVLGTYEYNWSFGESCVLQKRQWVGYEEIRRILTGFRTRYEYGDVYARLVPNS